MAPRPSPHSAAATPACIFVFFAMLALQGLLLNLLPPRLFERVSVYAQAILFTANVAALPFLWRAQTAAWWPPNWFLGFGRTLGGSVPGAGTRLAAWRRCSPSSPTPATIVTSAC